MKPIAVCDSCVLYPQTLRSALMYLAVAGLYQARWTHRIHDEWIGSLLETHGERFTREQLNHVRDLMDTAVPDALVCNYEHMIGDLVLPDLDDRHILAAAIAAEADVIITNNLRHFPQHVLTPYGVEAVSPDAFIARLFDSDQAAVLSSLRTQRLSLKNPPMTVDQFLVLCSGKDCETRPRDWLRTSQN